MLRVKEIMVQLKWMELIILNMLTERVIIQLELLLMIGCMWQVTSLIRQ